ncbi:MAG: hypothetical protein CM1200mP9_00580 [Gammaproteobacteria bacterium]|nr:MAG: hypothetical protein CM1200mP9_00580 [Gammaproteobacteria bacterium]
MYLTPFFFTHPSYEKVTGKLSWFWVFAVLYFGNWAITGKWDIYLATAGLMISALYKCSP